MRSPPGCSGDVWLYSVWLSLVQGGSHETLPLSLVHLVNVAVVECCLRCWCFLTSGCRQLVVEKLGCSIHSPPSLFQSGRCNRSNSPAKNWQVRPKLWWISRNLLSRLRGRGQTVGGVKSSIKGPIFAAKLFFGKILMGGFVSEGPAGPDRVCPQSSVGLSIVKIWWPKYCSWMWGWLGIWR